MLFEALLPWSPILSQFEENRSKRANLAELFGANLRALAVADGELNRKIMIVDHACGCDWLPCLRRPRLPEELPNPYAADRIAALT